MVGMSSILLPKLGGTLPSMFPKPQEFGLGVLPTGLAPLDCLLGGGFSEGSAF